MWDKSDPALAPKFWLVEKLLKLLNESVNLKITCPTWQHNAHKNQTLGHIWASCWRNYSRISTDRLRFHTCRSESTDNVATVCDVTARHKVCQFGRREISVRLDRINKTNTLSFFSYFLFAFRFIKTHWLYKEKLSNFPLSDNSHRSIKMEKKLVFLF